MIAKDPTDSKKIVKYDYSYRSEAPKAAGSAALIQNNDVTLSSYTVAKPGSKTAGYIPSELRLMLEEGLKGKTETVDYFARRLPSNVVSLQAGDGHFKGHLISGVTSTGTSIVGIVPSARVGKADGIASAQLSGGYLRTDAEFLESPGAHVFGRIEGHAQTPWLFEDKKVQVRGKVSGDGFLSSFIQAKEERTPGNGPLEGFEGTTQLRLGVQAAYESKSKKTNMNAEIQHEQGLGVSDSRYQQGSTLFPNLTYVSVQAEQKVTPKMVALADVAVGVRGYGSQVLAEAGVANQTKTRQITAGYQGRLNKNSPAFGLGMDRRAFLEAQAILKNWTFSGQVWQSLEVPTAPEVRLKALKKF